MLLHDLRFFLCRMLHLNVCRMLHLNVCRMLHLKLCLFVCWKWLPKLCLFVCWRRLPKLCCRCGRIRLVYSFLRRIFLQLYLQSAPRLQTGLRFPVVCERPGALFVTFFLFFFSSVL